MFNSEIVVITLQKISNNIKDSNLNYKWNMTRCFTQESMAFRDSNNSDLVWEERWREKILSKYLERNENTESVRNKNEDGKLFNKKRKKKKKRKFCARWWKTKSFFVFFFRLNWRQINSIQKLLQGLSSTSQSQQFCVPHSTCVMQPVLTAQNEE